MASVKIDQALTHHFINGYYDLPIAHENMPYKPKAGEAYAELLVIQNDVTALDFRDTNETDGIFRVILRYPVNTGSIPAKTMADEIFHHFAIGVQVGFEDQIVTIMKHDRAPGYSEQGWYKLVLTIGYKAFIDR